MTLEWNGECRPCGDTAFAEVTGARIGTAVGAAGFAATMESPAKTNGHAPRLVPPVEARPTAGTDPSAFWAARLSLTRIHGFARGRRVSPWAVLGGALTRVVAATEPNVQLPPTIGSYASLNLFIGLVGKSGAGKDAATKVARDAVDLGNDHPKFITAPLGSGEGMSHMFMKWGDDGLEQYNRSALVTIGEIDTLGALVQRQSSTVGSQLRQAAMGEALGFFYVDTAKRMLTPEHQYRMCLLAGIQPKRSGVLLGEADGGTPQRFVWLPATDPDAPDKRPDCPEPLLWVPPKWHEAGGVHVGGQYRNVIDVCDTACDIIDKAHLARTRDEGDALDGHALLTRLKVAAALAILEGRCNVGDDDWELSADVMVVSDAARETCIKALATEGVERNQKQAEAEATRAIVVGERVDEAKVRRASAGVKRKLARVDGWLAASDIRSSLSPGLREYAEASLHALVLSGAIEDRAVTYRGAPGTQYRLVGTMEEAA